MYQPICKQSGLILGKGTVVVVTGWKPTEAIASHLSPDQYAAVGNLYSPAGVSYLIRNILANPQVTGVLMLATTKQDENSGSVQALEEFFKGSSYKIPDIPQDDLERVRELSYLCLHSYDAETLAEYLQYLSDRPPLGGLPKYYHPPVVESPVVPGPFWGHRIEAPTVAQAWVKILHRIRSTGKESPSGYGIRQELIDLMTVVSEEPEEFDVPDWLPVDRPFLQNYLPQILEDAPVGVKYTYGSRMRSHFGVDQIEQVVSKLVNEIDAASAVINLWDVADHTRGGSPCLNHLWFRVIDGALSLTAIFRSNDMFDAWCANAFGLRALQMHVRDRINQETGWGITLAPLITLSESAHIYDHSYEYADKVIRERYGKWPKRYDDPVGNFEVSLEGGEIVVSRMLPLGTVCRRYRGKNPIKVVGAIAQDAPALQPDHALYLGTQLHKAWECLKRGEEFWQD
ncbi:MAG TPA: thymidylate synthase [Cyanophyceae cyanobacterium]